MNGKSRGPTFCCLHALGDVLCIQPVRGNARAQFISPRMRAELSRLLIHTAPARCVQICKYLGGPSGEQTGDWPSRTPPVGMPLLWAIHAVSKWLGESVSSEEVGWPTSSQRKMLCAVLIQYMDRSLWGYWTFKLTIALWDIVPEEAVMVTA